MDKKSPFLFQNGKTIDITGFFGFYVFLSFFRLWKKLWTKGDNLLITKKIPNRVSSLSLYRNQSFQMGLPMAVRTPVVSSITSTR